MTNSKRSVDFKSRVDDKMASVAKEVDIEKVQKAQATQLHLDKSAKSVDIAKKESEIAGLQADIAELREEYTSIDFQMQLVMSGKVQ